MEEKINGKPNNRTDNRNWTNRSNTIQKRWFLIYKTGVYFRCYYLRPYTGERSEYENIIPLEFSGDKCAELDRFNQGDVVTVSFVLQGRSWTNLDGELKRMASIRCYKIEARGGVSQPPQTAPAQQPVQQPTPQSTYQQLPDFPPPVDANGNPKDDLPF